MLIFSFKPRYSTQPQKPATVAQAVYSEFALTAHVVNNWDEFDALECFPFDVEFPAILVERPDFWSVGASKLERQIIKFAERNGAVFVGT